jgi:cellulose synthase/poly-beta-1,6-N-acetylglucosamine synthase-like glycosyltransferase
MPSHPTAALIFWISIAVLIFTYVGYPPLIWLFGRLCNRPFRRDPGHTPLATLIIAAHNEEAVIAEKIENALSQDYPADKLEIIIASDASSDQTVAIARRFASPRLRVLDLRERSGKLGAVVKAVRLARGQIIVLTDANAFYAPDTISQLAAPFADPAIGCVCGAKTILRDKANRLATDAEEGHYWQFESFIKSAETLSGSCVGADGSVYAVRAGLFPAPPLDRLLMDDLIISLMINLQGYRSVFIPQARAFEYSSPNSGKEFKRKARILAGALGVMQTIPAILRSSLAFKLFCHKILRWMTPVFMLTALFSSVTLAVGGGLLYQSMLGCQLLFYGCALTGLILEKLKRPLPLIKQCFYFTLTVTAQLYGVFIFLRDRKTAHWENLRAHAEKT